MIYFDILVETEKKAQFEFTNLPRPSKPPLGIPMMVENYIVGYGL